MKNQQYKIFLLGLIICLFTIPVNHARAESTMWSTQIQSSVWNNRAWTIDWPSIQIGYNVRVFNHDTGTTIACGSKVNKGTNISFQFVPRQYTDISWFGTGTTFDSPYGSWNAGAGLPGGSICVGKNAYQSRNTSGGGALVSGMFADFSVNPPNIAISGLPTDQCVGSGGGNQYCSTSRVGVLNANFNFSQTYGQFYGGANFMGGCYASSGAMRVASLNSSVVPIDARNISCPITVTEPPSQPPSAPIVRGKVCVSGTTPTTYTVSAIDKDVRIQDSQVRFFFDWDNDGRIDQAFPGDTSVSSGYVNSGVEQSISRVWRNPGPKTFKVLAADNSGLASPWTSVTVVDCPDESESAKDEEFIIGDIPVLIPLNPLLPGGPVVPSDSFITGTGPRGTIQFEMNPKITNTTCHASWKTQYVAMCALYKLDVKFKNVGTSGEMDVEPATYDLKCRQVLDGKTISARQTCIRNPSLREI